MKVLKFGGTSVGTAQRMQNVATLIKGQGKKIVVLSAMSGTTNSLVTIKEYLAKGEEDNAKVLIADLEAQYNLVVKDLLVKTTFLIEGKGAVFQSFNRLKELASTSFSIVVENEILAQGELLSTALFQLYLKEQGFNSKLLPALSFMRTDKDGEPDQFYIQENINRLMGENEGFETFITQGFICRDVKGGISNLKRGGSDYSASLIGAGAKVDEIQIWTDIDGIHNNDPRYVKNTQSLLAISFDEAAELAYFGAKILHPSSVAPAKAANIPVKLKNTLDPEADGTLISKNKSGNGIKAIAAKDHITAININSSKMLMAHGFLHKVFEVFKNHETSVDMITTSEVAVSLTIDDTTKLNSIAKELENYGAVKIEKDLSIVCVVGDFIAESKGYAFKIFQALQNVPIRMISFGGSQHNISLLVKTENKVESLQALHERVFIE